MTVSQDIVVHEATLDDAETLAAILRESFEEYRGVLTPPSSGLTETAEGMRERFEKATGLLAIVNDEPAGCVFFETEGDYVYLYRLGVRPAFRQAGIGRTLIENVEQKARESGYLKVRLATRIALEGNQVYYQRLGYRFLQFGERLHEARAFYVVMEKDLPESEK